VAAMCLIQILEFETLSIDRHTTGLKLSARFEYIISMKDDASDATLVRTEKSVRQY